MGITYQQCPRTVDDIVSRIIAEHHKDLEEAAVTVGCLFAHADLNKDGEPMQPAVKLHGWPCAAVVRITPYKKRVQGITDAEITIDGSWWEKATSEEIDALLDHELYHLIVKRDEKGVIQEDPHGRPKLK